MAVVGFGRASQAMVRYLHESGIRVLVSDIRNYSELSPKEQELLEHCVAEYEGGGHSTGFLSRADIVVASPGVDYRHSVLEKVRQSGATILGELALAADKFKAPVIGVTGTNGKTTVTELIGSIFEAAGKKVFVGGNIGTPIGEYLLSEEKFDAIVLELSSFQLELCGDFMPEVGILLNITPDHLDRHDTVESYAAAKMNMFQGGSAKTISVINGDDELCRRFSEAMAEVRWSRFGHDDSFEASISSSRVVLPERTYELAGSKLSNLSGLQNSAAALLGTDCFGLEKNAVQQALIEFEPGEHRLQRVACYNGITYINDSKATNTGAVNNAIHQVGSTEGGIVLIAGGKDKGDDYTLLRECVTSHVKRLILIGEASRAIGEVLGDLVEIDYPATLEEAVLRASAACEPGDTVLFSPACASFDMFDDYKQRGASFIEAVHRLHKRNNAEIHQ
ncbi:MAG: UDP-N-acetylmuramoyl-L-alanine--D-glutamate ligase [Desulfocapsaceae bacterium]